MKHETDTTENDNPIMNAVFIGLYLVALIVLLFVLAKRFFPILQGMLIW